MIIRELDRAECEALLASTGLGRLACTRDDQPYVVPFTYVAEGNHLYSFSLVGQKIAWMRENAKVCVQVDAFDGVREWRSVVVFGRYEELPDKIGWKIQRERAWSLLSQHGQWWEPGSLKPVGEAPTPHLFYRIIVDQMSGRHANPDG